MAAKTTRTPRPRRGGGDEASFHRIILDVLDRSGEMIFISNEPVEVVLVPKGSSTIELMIGALGRKRFPGVEDRAEAIPFDWIHDRMHVVGHDAPRKKAIALAIEMEECIFNQLRNGRVP